jgi:hypothetical protein
MHIRIMTALFRAALFFSSTASADPRNKKTVLTCRQSVQLPGLALAPGTYVFKVPDFEMQCIIGRAVAFSTILSASFTMLAFASLGTNTDGRSAELLTAFRPS